MAKGLKPKGISEWEWELLFRVYVADIYMASIQTSTYCWSIFSALARNVFDISTLELCLAPTYAVGSLFSFTLKDLSLRGKSAV